jgi:hypothetical protein
MATMDSKVGEVTTVNSNCLVPGAKPCRRCPRAYRPFRGRPVLILVVEDDDDVAAMATNMLKLIGYRADHVRDGATALALLLSGQRFARDRRESVIDPMRRAFQFQTPPDNWRVLFTLLLAREEAAAPSQRPESPVSRKAG